LPVGFYFVALACWQEPTGKYFVAVAPKQQPTGKNQQAKLRRVAIKDRDQRVQKEQAKRAKCKRALL
jgi:hypothetical protein